MHDVKQEGSMSSSEAITTKNAGSVRRQAPSFVVIGLIGYVVDSSITYALARGFGVNPFLARIPAYVIATIINFALNRALTFANSNTPLLRAFVKYVMVCAVGFVVNYLVYVTALEVTPMLGVTVTPAFIPLFVAMGAGVAMFFTFFGFKLFAFRS